MFVVIGLGNPGRRFSGTRHNVGFDTIDCLAFRHQVNMNKLKFNALFGETRIGNEKVLLVKPQTYMNRSGESVLQIIQYYKLPIESIILIYDDVDIDFATLRIRTKGSAGSHNGMKSVIYQLQNDSFPRVRIGIGRKPTGWDLADYVMRGFNEEERKTIDETIEKGTKAIEKIITDGINAAMNEYNG